MGTIPTELRHLRSLSELFVLKFISNKINIIFILMHLFVFFIERIDFGDNDLTGTVPTQLEHLTRLETLYLEGDKLSRTILLEIGIMNKLQYLALQQNNLSGSFPFQIVDATELKELALDNNRLTGSISTSIGQLNKFKNCK